MAFEFDPDKPDTPALARILSLFGVLSLLAAVVCMLLALSGYAWVNDTLVMGCAVGAFLFALLFVGQAKTIEMLAVISARVKSRFAVEALARAATTQAGEKKPVAPPNVTPKERVIHIPEKEAREQGIVKTR
jgi:hypothetical protein